MSTLVYFAVGGTGLRSVEPLLHLCALGLGPERIKLVMIDPDQTHPAGARALERLKLYQQVRESRLRRPETAYFRTEITIANDGGVWSPIASASAAGAASQKFSVIVDAAAMRQKTPHLGKLFDLLFDAHDEQEMSLEKGFRGRPSIGTVFMHSLSQEGWLREVLTERDARFFVAGSVFGGTGSSAIPVIGSVIRKGMTVDGYDFQPGFNRERLGAALVLPFFHPKGGQPKASDGGIMPDPAVFALNAVAAMPYYLRDPSHFGDIFAIGESVWRDTVAEVGGEKQDNGVHHVELLSALAALEFDKRQSETDKPCKFWVASASGQNVRIDDLPMSAAERERFSAGLVWAHTILSQFGDASGVSRGIERKLKGATWLSELGISAKELVQRGNLEALNALCQYASLLWDWASELSDMSRSPHLQLVSGTRRSAATTPLSESLVNRTTRDHSLVFSSAGHECFAAWNRAARKFKRGGLSRLLEVMEAGSVVLCADVFGPPEHSEIVVPRPLLPSLQDPNILAAPGSWKEITGSKQSLKKLKVQDGQGAQVVSIGSIPNPWARMMLFRDALEDAAHPATETVSMQLLDALEMLFRKKATNPLLRLETVDVRNLVQEASKVASQGCLAFARALSELYPYPTVGEIREVDQEFAEKIEKESESAKKGVEESTLANKLTLVSAVVPGRGDQIIAGSSAYTMLFTGSNASDKGSELTYGLFDPDKPRALSKRVASFQKYVLSLEMPNKLQGWREKLEKESGNSGHEDVLREMEKHSVQFSGRELYRTAIDIEQPSKWRMTTAAGKSIYLVDLQTFDGVFFEGAASVTLTEDAIAELSPEQRTTLPGIGGNGHWASPLHHWFTRDLVLMEEPLRKQPTGDCSVYGFSQFSSQAASNSAVASPRFLLPLTSEVLRYFSPQEIDQAVSIQIAPNEDVTVRLKVQLDVPFRPGAKQSATFEKVYAKLDYQQLVQMQKIKAPDIAVWPDFEGATWRDYLMLRLDPTAETKNRMHVRLYGDQGALLSDIDECSRSDGLRVTGCNAVPRAISFSVADYNGALHEVGALLPRFEKVGSPSIPKWEVGVDFGTSNTTVSRIENGKPKTMELSASASLLSESKSLSQQVDRYFMPARPHQLSIGTALLVSDSGPNGSYLNSDVPGVRASIPWYGVLPNEENPSRKVYGDLKWLNHQADVAGHYRTVAFMRQLLSGIAATAQKSGARSVEVSWSYPGAFSQTQITAFGGLWKEASLAENGSPRYDGLVVKPQDANLHESKCTLAYFQENGLVQVATGLLVVFDIGGGTTDIAMYGNNKEMLFDSVLLGGRNLTGRKSDGTENTFVRNLIKTLEAHAVGNSQLTDVLHTAKAYLLSGQDHLAFSFLASSSAFDAKRQLVYAYDEVRPFKARVLYMFGALLHYAGLAISRLQEEQGSRFSGNISLAFAGNGSRYLEWAGLQYQSEGFKQFARSCLLAGGAHGTHSVDVTQLGLSKETFVRVSSDPKREVALGMLSTYARRELSVSQSAEQEHQEVQKVKASVAPTCGEKVNFGADPESTIDVSDEMSEPLTDNNIARLIFPAEELESQRFSKTWLKSVKEIARGDAAFSQTLTQVNDQLLSAKRADTEQDLRVRLAKRLGDYGQWRGSLFLVQVEAALEKVLV